MAKKQSTFPAFGKKGRKGTKMSLGGVLTNPLVNAGIGLLQAGAQNRAQQRYDRDVNQRLYDTLTGLENRATSGFRIADQGLAEGEDTLRDTRNRAVSDARRFGQGLTRGYGARSRSVLGDVDTAQEGVSQGYGNLKGDAAGFSQEIADLISTQGNQARKDIAADFDRRESAALDDLAARGGGGSTVSASISGAIGGEKADALARLAESVAKLQAGSKFDTSGRELGLGERGVGKDADLQLARAAYNAAVTGDTLGATERGFERAFGADVGLSGALAGQQGANAMNRTNVYMQGTGDYLNTLAGVNDIPPDQSYLNTVQQLGANSAQPPSPPSSWDQFWGAAAPLVGSGAGSYVANMKTNSPSAKMSGTGQPLPYQGFSTPQVRRYAQPMRQNPIALGRRPMKQVSNRMVR